MPFVAGVSVVYCGEPARSIAWFHDRTDAQMNATPSFSDPRNLVGPTGAASSLPADPSAPSLGAIGPYDVAGFAPSGRVLARLRFSGRTVEIAELGVDHGRDTDAVQRLRIALAAVARLIHPSIPRVLGFELVGGRVQVAIEHVIGERLDRWASGGRTALEIAAVSILVCDAVRHAHENGVLHGDLTVHCIMVDPRTGHASVGGFGLADPARDRDAGASGVDTGVRRDVRALGAILSELLRHGPARGSRRRRAVLSAIAARASSDVPTSRYASVAELLADLRHGRSARRRARTVGGRTGRQWLLQRCGLAAAAAAIVLLAAVLSRAAGVSPAAGADPVVAAYSPSDGAILESLRELLTQTSAGGDPGGAAWLHWLAERLWQHRGDRLARAELHHAVGLAWLARDESEVAERHLAAAASLFRADPSRRWRSLVSCLSSLGRISTERRDPGAVELLREALEQCPVEAFGERAAVLKAIALALWKTRTPTPWEDAEQLFRRALALSRRDAAGGCACECRYLLASMLVERGRYDAAEGELTAVLTGLAENDRLTRAQRVLRARCRYELGVLLHRRGDLAAAEHVVRASRLEVLACLGPRVAARAQWRLAEILAERGQASEAVLVAHGALELAGREQPAEPALEPRLWPRDFVGIVGEPLDLSAYQEAVDAGLRALQDTSTERVERLRTLQLLLIADRRLRQAESLSELEYREITAPERRPAAPPDDPKPWSASIDAPSTRQQ